VTTDGVRATETRPSSAAAPTHNTWIHRLARLAVRPLADTAVTPNHLTTARLLVGLAAGAAFAVGRSPWDHAGSLLFLLSMILDRADGELARLSGKSSPWGHKYDLIADTIANSWAFVGLGIGLRESPLGAWAPVIGVWAGAAVGLILWIVLRAEATGGPRAAYVGTGGAVDPDDGMILLPLGVSLGAAVPLLVSAAVGTPIFALWLVTHLDHRRRAQG
jgi:phosphatidylglycerophosphate synthase